TGSVVPASTLPACRGVSMTIDEPAHSGMATILRLDARRFDDSKMPVSALNALPERLSLPVPPGRVQRGALCLLWQPSGREHSECPRSYLKALAPASAMASST